MKTDKILLLSNIEPGGAWIFTERFITKYVSDNEPFSVRIISAPPTTICKLKSHINIVKAPPSSPPFSFVKSFFGFLYMTYLAIKHISKDFNPDLVISTDYRFSIVASIFFFRRAKVVFWFHGSQSVLYNNVFQLDRRQILIKIFERLALLLSPLTVVPSVYAKSFVYRRLGLFASMKNVKVVENFVPDFIDGTKKYSKSKLRTLLKLNLNDNIVLYSGRISLYKGLEGLVSYFNRVDNKKIKLVVAAPTNNQNIRLVKLLKESKKIILFENLSPEKLYFLYQASDLLILPSEQEMAPLSVIEAAASGLSVAGTNTGNISDLVHKIDPNLILKNTSTVEIGRVVAYYFSLKMNKRQKISAEFEKEGKKQTFTKSLNMFKKALRSYKL